jgi:hypothetical protein
MRDMLKGFNGGELEAILRFLERINEMSQATARDPQR